MDNTGSNLSKSSTVVDPLIESTKLWQTRMAAGHLAYEAGEYLDACRQFRLTLELAEKHRLEQHCKARSKVGLAKAISAMGKYDEAERLIREALTIDQPGESAVAAAEDYHQLSLLYWRRGKIGLAFETAERAWQLSMQASNVPDELRAKLLKHFAVLNLESGHYAKCEQYLNTAIGFILGCGSLDRHSSIYGDVLLVKVLLSFAQNKSEEAMELYPQAMQIIEMNRGFNNPRVHEVQEVFRDLKQNDLQAQASQIYERLIEGTNHTRHGII